MDRGNFALKSEAKILADYLHDKLCFYLFYKKAIPTTRPGKEPIEGFKFLRAFFSITTESLKDLAAGTIDFDKDYFQPIAKHLQETTLPLAALPTETPIYTGCYKEFTLYVYWNKAAQWYDVYWEGLVKIETAKPQMPENSEGILTEALSAVTARRGSPSENFTRCAEHWNSYLRSKGLQASLGPLDVALMMVLVKVSRLEETPTHRDSWVDIAGYADCAGEILSAGSKTSPENIVTYTGSYDVSAPTVNAYDKARYKLRNGADVIITGHSNRYYSRNINNVFWTLAGRAFMNSDGHEILNPAYDLVQLLAS
jgi:hypothetical protein